MAWRKQFYYLFYHFEVFNFNLLAALRNVLSFLFSRNWSLLNGRVVKGEQLWQLIWVLYLVLIDIYSKRNAIERKQLWKIYGALFSAFIDICWRENSSSDKILMYLRLKIVLLQSISMEGPWKPMEALLAQLFIWCKASDVSKTR